MIKVFKQRGTASRLIAIIESDELYNKLLPVFLSECEEGEVITEADVPAGIDEVIVDDIYNKLGAYVSEDDLEETLRILEGATEDGYGDESADDYVTMWEPMQNRYTVNQLLDEIS